MACAWAVRKEISSLRLLSLLAEGGSKLMSFIWKVLLLERRDRLPRDVEGRLIGWGSSSSERASSKFKSLSDEVSSSFISSNWISIETLDVLESASMRSSFSPSKLKSKPSRLTSDALKLSNVGFSIAVLPAAILVYHFGDYLKYL